MSYEEANEEKRVEYIHDLTEKARAKGSITYREVAEMLESVDMDKDQIDEVYESLMTIGIEVTSEVDPEEFAILSLDHDDVEPDPDIIATEEIIELDLDVSMPKGIAVDDPVRMYLKEIGKVSLLSGDEEIELAMPESQAVREAGLSGQG